MVKVYVHVLTNKRLLDNEMVVIVTCNEGNETGTVQSEIVAPLIEKYARMTPKRAGFPATLSSEALKLHSNEKDLKSGTEMPRDKKIRVCKLKNKQDLYCFIAPAASSTPAPAKGQQKQQQSQPQGKKAKAKLKAKSNTATTEKDEEVEKAKAAKEEEDRAAQEMIKKAEELIGQKKDLRKAKTLLEHALSVRPNDPDALFQLGNINLQAGGARRIADARKYMQRGLNASPGRLDFYVAMGDICTAEGNYPGAGDYYRTAIEQLGRLAEAASGPAQGQLRDLLDDVLVKGAETAIKAGEAVLAEKLVTMALRHNQKNVRALLAYAALLQRKSERAAASAGGSSGDGYEAALEALQVRLQVVVALNNYQPGRAAFAESMRGQYGMRGVRDTLKGLDPKGASAYGFLGGIVKDYGMFEESVALYREELALRPESTSCCLNIAHAYENLGWLGEAFRAMCEFLRANPALAVLRLTCAHVLHVVEPLTADSYAALAPLRGRPAAPDMAAPAPGILDEAMLAQIGPPPPAKYIYPEEQLNLLAMFFTLVKVLYLAGYLQFLPPLIRLLKPLRENRDLHLTLIRNEQAYFACLEMLVADIAPHLPISIPADDGKPPIYVVGDSHSLTLGWQHITAHHHHPSSSSSSSGAEKEDDEEITYLLRPYLVTGIKIWHLREESTFYPKANFWNIIKTIPKGSIVLLIIGEIDCREGILDAVQKCRYDSLEEGIREVLAIYKRILTRLQCDRGLRLLVHPAAPVLNETREIVHLFDTLLREELRPLQSDTLRFLDIADSLVNESWTALREEFALDGTHLRANYVSQVLEPAVSEALAQMKH